MLRFWLFRFEFPATDPSTEPFYPAQEPLEGEVVAEDYWGGRLLAGAKVAKIVPTLPLGEALGTRLFVWPKPLPPLLGKRRRRRA